MATLDRIEPAYTPWTPSASGLGISDDDAARDEDAYVGRHRKPGARTFSLHRMWHTARHRRR